MQASGSTAGVTTGAALLDATLVRLLLLPAPMTVLGDRNWSAPRWLAGRQP